MTSIRSMALSGVLLSLIFCVSAQSTTWSSPVALSTGGEGWEAAAAIDGAGNSVAVWDERTTRTFIQDHIWSRSQPNGGNWARVTQVSQQSPSLGTTTVYPAVRISAAGSATAVWTDSDGTWTADRPPHAAWNPPQHLASASGVVFAMNSKGDAVVAWSVGGPRDPSGAVMAMLRPAGAGWTAPQTVATANHVTRGDAGISENGTVIVTWETYTAVCNTDCYSSNFALHASRQQAGSGTWSDSGMLLGPDPGAHDSRVALDATGRAALVTETNSFALVAAVQGASGGQWSTFTTIDTPRISILTDVASDSKGNLTAVYLVIDGNISQVFSASGAIATNSWTPAAVISGADQNCGQVLLALAPSGAALSVWLNSGAKPAVHAVVRAAATAPWGTPATISKPGSSMIAPEAAAVNSAGKAVAIYSGYSTGGHTEFAVNYTP